MPSPLPALLALFLALHISLQGTHATTHDAEEYLRTHRDAHRVALKQFLSLQSVSSDPSCAPHIERAAEWVSAELKSSGLEHVQLLRAGGHPSVYADWLHASDAPTVLIYAHFDVQPADPLELWDSPPFEATERDGRIFARGVSDDKGNLYATILAVRAHLQSGRGKLPVNVKFLLEGEEEVGSPTMGAILEKYKELLKADYAFSADGGQISRTQPGLCVGLRGSVAMEVSVRTADSDAHAGSYGGGVQNALHALAKIVSSLHHPENGSVMVNGFYDDVDALSEKERKEIQRFPTQPSNYLERIGALSEFGEKGFSFLER